MDVHKRKRVATIRENAKGILKRVEFENDVRGINGFIGMIRREGRMPATAVCGSAGNYWIVLHDAPEEAGINTLPAHPHRIKAITQTFYKNDKADSEKLAELLRPDVVPESFVANRSQRDLRELTRTGLQQNTSTPRNRIHAILAKYPRTPPDCGLFAGDGRDRLRDVRMGEIDRMVAELPPGSPGLPVRAGLQAGGEDSADFPEEPAGPAHHDHTWDRPHHGRDHTCRDCRPQEVYQCRKAGILRRPVAGAPQQRGDGEDGRHNKARLRLAAQGHGRGRNHSHQARYADTGTVPQAGPPHRCHEGQGLP